MKTRSIFKGVGALLAAAATLASSGLSQASSHREAPFLTKNPKVDATDFYMFNSYEASRTGFVTLIANYQPLQDPIGGPNYFTMDPEALYEIHIDNNADAQEDITFQFRFQNTLANAGKGVELPIGGQMVAIPLVNAGPVNGSDPFLGAGSVNNINQKETFSAKVVRGNRRTGTAADITNVAGNATTFTKPLDNIGAKTFSGGYDAYARQHVYNVNIPGCTGAAKIFVGQRAESFAVNLGTIFDLINAPLGVIANENNRAAVPNPIGGKNITSIAMEVPVGCLRTGTTGAATIIGGWTTASVRQARVINPQATYTTPAREGGAWAQVSRLGAPLVNEVVIGLRDKDRWNSAEPKSDAQFATYVTNPTLPKLIELIYGAANAPAPTGTRSDLAAAFLTGVPGVNANGATAEYLRLNTALPASSKTSQTARPPAQRGLGALECFTSGAAQPTLDTAGPNCDPAGFPNGRRPGDDTVDIALRVVMGRLLPSSAAPAGRVPLHDAVLQSAADFDDEFPYVKTPKGGS